MRQVGLTFQVTSSRVFLLLIKSVSIPIRAQLAVNPITAPLPAPNLITAGLHGLVGAWRGGGGVLGGEGGGSKNDTPSGSGLEEIARR